MSIMSRPTGELSQTRLRNGAARNPEFDRLVDQSVAELAQTDIVARALKAGNIAPDFSLRDTAGDMVTLSTVLRSGPVVLSFLRGVWCPYCVAEVAAYRARANQIAECQTQVIFVTPQPGEWQDSDHPGISVLADTGALIAQAYGLAHQVAPELMPHIARMPGAPTDCWVVPIPATYVISQTGEIVMAFLDTDHRQRLDPDDALAAVVATQRVRNPKGN